MKVKIFAPENMGNICALCVFERETVEKHHKNHVANVKIMLKQKKTLKLLIEPFDAFLHTFSIVRSVFSADVFSIVPETAIPSTSLLTDRKDRRPAVFFVPSPAC